MGTEITVVAPCTELQVAPSSVQVLVFGMVLIRHRPWAQVSKERAIHIAITTYHPGCQSTLDMSDTSIGTSISCQPGTLIFRNILHSNDRDMLDDISPTLKFPNSSGTSQSVHDRHL